MTCNACGGEAAATIKRTEGPFAGISVHCNPQECVVSLTARLAALEAKAKEPKERNAYDGNPAPKPTGWKAREGLGGINGPGAVWVPVVEIHPSAQRVRKHRVRNYQDGWTDWAGCNGFNHAVDAAYDLAYEHAEFLQISSEPAP